MSQTNVRDKFTGVQHAPDRPVGTIKGRKINRNSIRAYLFERGFIKAEVAMANRDYALVDLSGVPEPRREVAEAYFESLDGHHREPEVEGYQWGIEV